MSEAPRTTAETAAYLRDKVESGTTGYRRLCLRLQREARGLPAVYPTAFAASQATPKEERVYDTDKWKRGMVGFSYDPRIPGTAGHIFFVAGRNDAGDLITISNDVKEVGAVDYVKVDFYTNVWGQKLQFAASWLNGYDFKDESKPSKPIREGSLGDTYEESLRLLTKVYERKLRKYGENNPLVKNLRRDVKRMERKLERWS